MAQGEMSMIWSLKLRESTNTVVRSPAKASTPSVAGRPIIIKSQTQRTSWWHSLALEVEPEKVFASPSLSERQLQALVESEALLKGLIVLMFDRSAE